MMRTQVPGCRSATVTVLLFALALPLLVCAQVPGENTGKAAWLVNRVDWEITSLTGAPPPQDEVGGSSGGGAASEPGQSKKNPAVPMIMSLVIPGAGEVYLGYKRGYFMMAFDIAVWMGVAYYNNQGYDKRDEYYQFAEEHWSEPQLAAAFWSSHPDEYLAGVGLNYFDTGDCEDCYQNLPLWVSREEDEREWFENLGKWDQFVFGWDDFVRPEELPGYVGGGALSDLRLQGISDNREFYRTMRQESNDYFTKRDRLIYLNIATRVLSVIQVAVLQGMFSGGDKNELKVAGHPVSLVAEPRGFTSTRIGLAVSY